jgi:protein-disulfide isomerase
MHRQLARLFVVMVWTITAPAQPKAAPAPHPAAKPATEAGLPSEGTVNSFLKETFGYEAAVQWKIVEIKRSTLGLVEVDVILSNPEGQQMTRLLIAPDGKHALVGDIIPFGAKPYAPAREQLALQAAGPSRGPKDAPVTMVEFSDFQCPHCKEVQPAVDKLLAAEPNVRLVFQNFPLPNHNWAMKAASYADCVGRTSNDAFWKFSQSVFEAQPQITEANAEEKLTLLADAAGVKGAEMAACAAKPETATRVQKSADLGKAVEVNSTPTFFINGRRISNLAALPPEFLKKLVEFHAQEGK